MNIFSAHKTNFFLNLFIFLFLCISPVFAIAKFNTTYQVYYKVLDTGSTHVTFVISQKNNLSVVYATEFGISLNETQISNLKILDEGVLVTPTVNKGQNQTVISFPFAKKVVGKDKVHNFTIEYETTDIVNKQGNTWQLNIPRFESDENISDQTAILTLPANFSQPAYIDPKPDIINGNTYYFSSKILGNKPISAIFGKNQYYKGKLSYFIQNSSTEEQEKTITLLPNTPYQSVYYEKIEPKPDSFETDKDGNLLGVYTLKKGQEVDVQVTVFVRTDYLPRENPSTKNFSYLESNKIWNYDHNIFTIPEVKNLTSPKAIYEYVSNKLKYDYQKINQEGTTRVAASESLKNYLSAICTDYTDLFIALARKANIPTRELEGLAISNNPDLKPISDKQDVLHAWPEYFDESKNLWIQVDPTWGSTSRGLDFFNKLDFNHLVFAIHGVNPDLPPPAGSFKKPNSNAKDIIFEPIEEIVFPQDKYEITQIKGGLKDSVLKLKNQNGVYLSGTLTISETDKIVGLTQSINIPPYGETEVLVSHKPLSFFSQAESEAIINFNGREQIIRVSHQNIFQKGFIFAGIGLVLGVLALLARGLLLRRQK